MTTESKRIIQSKERKANNFLETLAQPRDFSSTEVMSIVKQQGEKPRSVRIAEFETGRLKTAIDLQASRKFEEVFEDLNQGMSAEAKELQRVRLKNFESDLDKIIKKDDVIDFPYMGEEFVSTFQVNNGFSEDKDYDNDPGLIGLGREDLILPAQLSGEEFKKLARFRYIVESKGIGHIVAGYSRQVLDFWRNQEIAHQTNIYFVLRDGAVAYASAKGLASENDKYLPNQEKGEIRAEYINSAMADPLFDKDEANNKKMIYTSNVNSISKTEALTYIEQIGLMKRDKSTYTLLADTASMGTLPIMLDKARQIYNCDAKFAMIALAGGWQGNPLIPNYSRYLASGNWISDPDNEDPTVLKKSEIVHTYAENNFAGYTKRPEKFIYKNGLLTPVEEPFNDATSILSWVSNRAGFDAGAIHGLMERTDDPELETIPKKSLDLFWSMWTHTIDGTIPNIAFCPWRPRHAGKEGIMNKWNNTILEDILLDK